MTLPKQIRAIFGLDTPGRVTLDVDKKNNSITIKKQKDVFDLAGTFVPKRKTSDPVKLRSYMEKRYKRF
tara:strand:+ start:135 stop:341 length:207 start_codon:yes stop_codon:yes gene_type:complete